MDAIACKKMARRLREAAGTWDGGSPDLPDEAVEALAGELGTSAFLLDMRLESASRREVKEAMLSAAEKLEAQARKGARPDALGQVLSGDQDWGTVEVPPGLLRSMWRAGEALDLWLGGRPGQEQFDEAMLDAMEAAWRWVRLRKGLDHRAPLMRAVEVLTLDGQRRLLDLNAGLPGPGGGPAPF